MINKEPLPSFLSETSKIGDEISITGKWIPTNKSNFFKSSTESKEILKEWEDIHLGAKRHEGILSTGINHVVGQDAVLVHHVFSNTDSLNKYFLTTAKEHFEQLTKVAKPEIHLLRGTNISEKVEQSLLDKNVPAVFGEHIFGYVKDNYKRPNQETAIQVTAKWTCNRNNLSKLEELKYWWQRVGTDAYSMEEGLLRFEVYQVKNESALIIHETFNNTNELKFHLSKGTAEKYKKDIDKIASPECYFFRGPVSWTIRTYSKFLRLPATYSSLGSNFTAESGSMSDGRI